MRKYNLYKLGLISPFLGPVNIQIDESQSTEYGDWRQLKPFNHRLPAAGKWKCLTGTRQPTLFIYEVTGSYALAILDGFYKSVGRRGVGKLQVKSVSDKEVQWYLEGVREVEEITIQDIAERTVHSTWKLAGSRGISYSVGEGLEVVGGTGEFTIEGSSKGKRSQHKLIYSTAGVGVGFSELPFSVSGSTADMPSGGIGNICTTKKEMSLWEFEGFCTIVEVSANSGGSVAAGPQSVGGGLFAVIFSLGANPCTTPILHLMGKSFYGFMYGSQLGITGPSIGASYSMGSVVVMP